MNLRLNKESLTVMLSELQLKDSKEKSLIETINIISQENTGLKMQISRMKAKLDRKTKVDAGVQTKIKIKDKLTSTFDLAPMADA